MQDTNAKPVLRQTPKNTGGSFGNVPQAKSKRAAELMDRAIAMFDQEELPSGQLVAVRKFPLG